MEGSDISRVDSARASGYNIWRNNSMDVFSTSEREDDEEALKWAAIERLPTYLRIRRSILNNEDGKGREVDIKQLGLTERKFLMERLVKIAEEDNERFLLKLRERMDRTTLFHSTPPLQHKRRNHWDSVSFSQFPTLYLFVI
ncbi:pleiotropic drug resistance protein 1-like [Glycine max]|uniref:pleiotropic drug resistance protein 1-like n=1 Tax=Glycine max TaxID=3847 RepID=UPI0003DE9873|nr:pleiotropic drug resistance protein 1-like [Glycine max]